jgi:hypothetical protein
VHNVRSLGTASRHWKTYPEGGAGVTWQEELRKLDEDLASGKLSADTYRVRRDQVLSAAVSSVDPAQPPNPAADTSSSTQIIEPVSPPSGFQQQNQPEPSQSGPIPMNNPEATQAVAPHDTSAERTQAVPPWQAQQGRPPAGGYRQQGPVSPPGGFAQQQPPTWNAPQEDVSPPWASSELPPIAPQGGFEWVAQGPDSFEDGKPSGKGRKIVWSAVGVVVVVAIGLAVWLLFGRGNGNDTQASPPAGQPAASTAPSVTPLPMPPPAKPEPEDDKSALITAPGTPRNGGGDLGLATLKTSKLLPDTVTQALDQGGMTSGRLNTSTQGSSTIGLYSLTLPNSQAASTVAAQYSEAQQSGGLPANRDLSMQGVPVFSTPPNTQQAVYRAVYVLYSRVIIVETFGTDQATVQSQFNSLLQSQVDHAPPTQHTP